MESLQNDCSLQAIGNKEVAGLEVKLNFGVLNVEEEIVCVVLTERTEHPLLQGLVVVVPASIGLVLEHSVHQDGDL